MDGVADERLGLTQYARAWVSLVCTTSMCGFPGGRGLGGTLSLWLVGHAHTADGHRAPARTFPRGSLLCALRPWLRDVVHAKAPMPSLLDGTLLARLDDVLAFALAMLIYILPRGSCFAMIHMTGERCFFWFCSCHYRLW